MVTEKKEKSTVEEKEIPPVQETKDNIEETKEEIAETKAAIKAAKDKGEIAAASESTLHALMEKMDILNANLAAAKKGGILKSEDVEPQNRKLRWFPW